VTQPEPREATQDNPVGVTVEDLVIELTNQIGADAQQLAGQRVLIRKQQKLIEDLQAELTAPRRESDGPS
jgi:hypothetical protein